ncbi:MAG: Gfo/Idh/MocA family protein [Anaerolineae bacterium]|jgi:predicted dehydrogenase
MTYRVGVSGLRRGMGLARVFDAMPDCQVVALCDINPTVLERAAQQFPEATPYQDYSQMLADGLDIAVVATPIPVHRDQTVAALEAGCHVLQEVTLADSIEACRDIVRAVEAHPGQKFMLAENCCYWAHIMSWTEMWKQGLLGDFIYAEAEYVHDIRALARNPDGTPTWRAVRPPIVYCTHSLGPLVKITGERPVSVSALHTGNKMEPDLPQFYDFEVAIVQTESHGVIKLLRGQGMMREPAFHYYSLYGTRGTLETSRPPRALQTNAYLEQVPHLQNMIEMPLNTDVPGAAREAALGGHGTAEYFMVRDFLEAVHNDTPSPIDVYMAWDLTVTGLCAHESAMDGGRPVRIPRWDE